MRWLPEVSAIRASRERGRMGEARFNRTEMVRDLVTVENGDGGSVAKFGSSNGALAVT
jgi:hypothetical protein